MAVDFPLRETVWMDGFALCSVTDVVCRRGWGDSVFDACVAANGFSVFVGAAHPAHRTSVQSIVAVALLRVADAGARKKALHEVGRAWSPSVFYKPPVVCSLISRACLR